MEVGNSGENTKPGKKSTVRTRKTAAPRRGRAQPAARRVEKPLKPEALDAEQATTASVKTPANQVDVAQVASAGAKGRSTRRRKPAVRAEESPPVVIPMAEVPDLGDEELRVVDEPLFTDEPEFLEPTLPQPAAPQPRQQERSRGGRRGGTRRSRGKAQPRELEAVGEVPWEDEEDDKGRARPAAGPSRRRVEETESDDEFSEEDEPRSRSDGATRRMLINVSGADECRVAVLSNGRLEELFIERASTQSHVGNIYKGRITNVEPSIQAVFVDFGLRKDGFLHVSDVQPQYFPEHKGAGEEVGRKIPRHLRPPIQRCFRRGQEVIVQVTKEGVGTKGPTLTTYLSIPGRFLVMMPGMHGHGVSRKIEDDVERRKMRDIMKELKLPPGMGFILRTAGLDRTKRDLQRDLNYLLRLWKTVAERVRRMPAPAELYRESDLVTRTIRDVYSLDFERIIVDDAETARQAQEFIQIAMPRAKTVVELYSAREPLFHCYKIEQEIEKINMRHVPLPSGGSLVIDSTEALVAIDVNSGRFRAVSDAEELAFRTNMEAALEIARQLRLRDLGGLIICDFIDMRQERHMRMVERRLRDELKDHKERARILRMSAFGIIEMTRQRQGPSMKRSLYDDCPHCKGSGLVKMPESIMLDAVRLIQLATHHADVQKVTIRVAHEVAGQILNSKRALLHQIEQETSKAVIIRGEAGFTGDQMECTCEDSSGRPVNIGAVATLPRHGTHRVAL